MQIEDILRSGPVVPVIVLDDADTAVPLARALLEGGVRVLEVTLRTPAGLESIRRILAEVPDAIVGAGTEAMLWGAILLASGVPVYLLMRRRSSREA